MFFGFCFFILFHIYRFYFAVDSFNFDIRFQVCFAHLQWNESSGQCHYSDIMSGTCFHGNNIAFVQLQFVAVLEISFARILELNFNHLLFLGISGNISQPVVSIQLFILSSAAFAIQTAASVL